MKKVFVIVALLISFFCLFGQIPKDAELNKIMDETTALFHEKSYQKAAKKINEVFEYYAAQDLEIPENVTLMGETIYGEWLTQMAINRDVDSYKLLREILRTHPFKASDTILKRLDKMYEIEKKQIEERKSAASQKLNSNEWLQYDEMLLLSKHKQEDLIDVLKGDKSRDVIQQEESILAEIKRQNSLQKFILILVLVLSVSLIIVICFLIANSIKRRNAEDKFEVIMNVVSLLNRNIKNNPEEEIKRNNQELPKSFEHKELLTLEKACNELGSKIDDLTCRKNNSKKVGEIVYKMALELGLSEDIALLYFCAAMVYDSGFLAIDKAVFESEHLTVKQRYWIRDHVKKAREYFDFVPKDVLPLFLDAAEFHHENLDGSGYIDGMHDKEIPLIARLIHTAESYVSLVNRRNYHKIMDKESAINELKKRAGIYDPKTIEVLEEIV